jgi:ectoine hydroxylase-related dioxygenase (phytanoyl-CoA dioxygenase family)
MSKEDTMALTMEQVRLFRHNGFFKLPGRLPEPMVERLKEAIWRDIRAEVEPVVRNREGQVVRLSNILDRDPIFREAATSVQILDPLESLLGPNIELIMNRHNHATLRTASENTSRGLHRDVRQWSRTIFTVLVYLEETTVENGCTVVIPGTHHYPGVSSNLYDQEWARDLMDQLVPVPMPAGGLLVIDSMLLHSVGHNRTEGTRISMTLGYHSVDELMDVPNPKRLLVRGERPYAGNDSQY